MTEGMSRNGFTLLELLTSMAIASLLIVTGAAVLVTSGDGYSRARQIAVVEREARAVFHQIERDLAVVVMAEMMSFGQSSRIDVSDHLGFLCLKPEIGNQLPDGDLCSVRYYLKTMPIGGRSVQCLMRGVESSESAYEHVEMGAVEDLLNRRLERDEPIGIGVVSFEVKSLVRLNDGSLIQWRPDLGGRPEWLWVKLVLAKPELRARLDKEAEWLGSEWLGDADEYEQHDGLHVMEARIEVGP